MSQQLFTVTFTTSAAAEAFATALREHGADSDARVDSERVVLFTSWATAETVHALAFKFDTHAVVEAAPPAEVTIAAHVTVNYKASFGSVHAAHTFYKALKKTNLVSGLREKMRTVWYSAPDTVAINVAAFGGSVVALPPVAPIDWSGMWQSMSSAMRVAVVVGVSAVVLACAGFAGLLITNYEETPKARTERTPGQLQTDIGSPAACSGIETDISEMTAFEKRAWLALDC